jgi:hypothetical protein
MNLYGIMLTSTSLNWPMSWTERIKHLSLTDKCCQLKLGELVLKFPSHPNLYIALTSHVYLQGEGIRLK